ncbi:hypothetical protein Despr_1036 [Desulfobulbus propionicus DSM 2032]|jgi:hypothetical protein|uniref:Secreted protein n=1 Tax=Desulfobulbus propionicus (strain ATCC 33891 / DSM 2032 / VKM B-1956 / 1pr3) TaxID=577650 RepID=A0A7U3YKR9_DESPD|nr:hypothetical protein [Desulfobulbus propionicus]ADW17208.1 hypothetical protein Despr_1036 [Desulfobulbus propionicus DSM 2032]
MKLPRPTHLILLLLILIVCLAPCLQAAEPDGLPTEHVQTAVTPQEAGNAPPRTDPSESQENIHVLKQRYGQDPTGVRARLGLCRRGHHGGHGMHRGQACPQQRYRGGERWRSR